MAIADFLRYTDITILDTTGRTLDRFGFPITVCQPDLPHHPRDKR